MCAIGCDSERLSLFVVVCRLSSAQFQRSVHVDFVLRLAVGAVGAYSYRVKREEESHVTFIGALRSPIKSLKWWS